MTTIMVSPIARDTASRNPAMMPGSAAGTTTFVIVSAVVAPSPSEASRNDRGTARSASSDNDETNGMIMIPITVPAASALSEDTPSPRLRPTSRTKGATVSAAKKPATTGGTPARHHMMGLAAARNGGGAYSAR